MIGHLKPLIDRLAAVRPEFLARVRSIIDKVALLTEDVTTAAHLQTETSARRSKSKAAVPRKSR